MKNLGITMAVIAAAASLASADTVLTSDGRVLNGRVIQQKEKEIIFEVDKYGAKMQVSLDRSDVVSLKLSPVFKVPMAPLTGKAAPATQPAAGAPTTQPAEASYYVIPIKGEIGKDVQKELIRQGLQTARLKKAGYIVYEIDSPGGSVGETEEILGIMTEKSDLRRVAIVSKALSSAAVLCMACNDVFVQPGATIGAALPIPAGPTPQPLDEKVLSAIRAMARSAAEMGGHNTLLIQGMMETDMELGLTVKDGKPLVAAGHDGKLLKERGKILTLTAHEAVDCGLARAITDDPAEIGRMLGIAKWQDATGAGRMLLADMSKRESPGKTARLTSRAFNRIWTRSARTWKKSTAIPAPPMPTAWP